MKLTFEKMFNLMKKRKITADELCRKAGISHALISKMKKDTEIYKSAHEYSMNTLAQIAEALGVIPGSIMDLSDDDDLKARPDEKSTVIILPKGLSGIPYAREGENPFIPDGKSLEECHRGLPFLKVYGNALPLLEKLTASERYAFRLLFQKMLLPDNFNNRGFSLSHYDRNLPTVKGKEKSAQSLERGRRGLISKGFLFPARTRSGLNTAQNERKTVQKYYPNPALLFTGNRKAFFHSRPAELMEKDLERESDRKALCRLKKSLLTRDGKPVDIEDRESFIKIYKGPAVDRLMTLTPAGLRIMFLAMHKILEKQDTTLIDIKPDATGLKETTFQKAILSCRKAELLSATRTEGKYFINPLFMYNGDTKGK